MIELRTILCPVDTSDFSARAARYAVAIGREYGAEVVAMSVHPVSAIPAFWGAPDQAHPQSLEEQQRAIAAIRSFVRDAAGMPPENVRVAYGRIVPEIVRVARELPADLIVIGTHGTAGFEALVLGSVTEKVLRKAPCPVLTIPRVAPELAEPRVSTIVCGVDQSAASRRALRCALGLAWRRETRLLVVHALEDISAEEPRFASHFNIPECWKAIAPDIRASYEALIAEVGAPPPHVEVLVPCGKARRVLLDVAREARADLIVLGTAGTTTPLGGTTHHVIREAECPVLALPPDERSAARP